MRTPKPVSRRICAIFAVALLFGVATAANAGITRIVGTDDWPANSVLDPGEITCAQGEVVWVNPVTPTCPAGGPLRLRDTLAYSCDQAATINGAPEPRFTGVMSMTLNGNLDAGYSGPVWGEWMLVPSGTCDPQVLADPQEYWHGSWFGKRAQICTGGQCKWLGSLKIFGRGKGGALHRQLFRGAETVETFSPLPVPFELLGICGPAAPCPSEGRIVGTLWKR